MAKPIPIPIDPTALEEWRPIPGYENLYQVSDQGRVRAVRYRNGFQNRMIEPRIMRPGMSNGYWILGLYDEDGRRFNRSVHGLVAEVFIGPRPPGLHVAHLNGNRSDNRFVNLAYVTPTENERHKNTHGTSARGERQGCATISDDDVEEIRRIWRPRGPGVGTMALARRYGVWPGTISAILYGRNRALRTNGTPWSIPPIERSKHRAHIGRPRASGRD